MQKKLLSAIFFGLCWFNQSSQALTREEKKMERDARQELDSSNPNMTIIAKAKTYFSDKLNNGHVRHHDRVEIEALLKDIKETKDNNPWFKG